MSIPDKLAYKIDEGAELTADERSTAAKIIRAFGQYYYNQTGSMFICGASANEADGLPDMIMVCPTYGADIRDTTAYKKVKDAPSDR